MVLLVRCAIASCLALGAFIQTQSAAFAATANCTAAEKTQADKQLWLNARDKKASIAQHLPWGVPTESTSTDHERLLAQRDYVIDYDADLRIPIWVGYRLDSIRLGKSKRIDCFRSDPRLDTDDASRLSDYDEPIFDQGHLANNADMTSSRVAVINSFVLSNMTPQYCQFNEGVFQMLENIVRLWAKASGTVYVITGSILDRDGDRRRDADSAALRMRSKNGNERVAIPTAFFKVIVRPKEDGNLDTITLILPNDQTDLDGQQAITYIRRHVSTISRVERMTGLKLLPGFSGRVTQARILWPFTGSAGHSLVQARCRSTAGHLH